MRVDGTRGQSTMSYTFYHVLYILQDWARDLPMPLPQVKLPQTVDQEGLQCTVSHTWVLKDKSSQAELRFPPTW